MTQKAGSANGQYIFDLVALASDQKTDRFSMLGNDDFCSWLSSMAPLSIDLASRNLHEFHDSPSLTESHRSFGDCVGLKGSSELPGSAV